MGKSREKIERLRAALSHREADRVPVGEFFWTGFVRQYQARYGPGFDPYRHFDLDYIVITPNLDPRIRPFEVLLDDGRDVVVRTGFGATIRRAGDAPMPHYEAFSVNRPEEMADFAFDPPDDPRRFYAGGDDQINCVGDALLRNLPPWDERVAAYADDFAVFGSVCEPYEYLWRVIGSENALTWMATHAEPLGRFVDRIGQFMLRLAEAQIAAGKGRLCGMYLWGDVAYVRGMLFGARRWRAIFKPHVKALIDLFHRHGLLVVYHGCGNAREIFDDLVEIGLDAYNPLEAKAGLDVVELKRQYAGRLAFVGNIDVRVLERGDREAIRRHVRYKLQAARGGGWVMQSDHSISSGVKPESYETAIAALRQWGQYPLACS
ncbi:MAG: uroporphyrinogen decarboxylase family protein [Thermoguttaceae bacterium]|nr:uroporphyrinogen decarboxylase family protein [Thermoguttaceae bacterium]